jgi:deoxyguanosine kinase
MGRDGSRTAQDPGWVAIEGLIGAGKTTTARLLSEKLGIPAIFEQVEGHPLIGAYYRDPARFALETELVFSAIRLHEAKQLAADAQVVSDFAPAKTLIFAGRQLDEADLAFLTAIDTRLWKNVAKPGLTLFLDVPSAECLSRIQHRGRDFEAGLQLEDLEELRDAYLARLDTLGEQVMALKLSGQETASQVAESAALAIGACLPPELDQAES